MGLMVLSISLVLFDKGVNDFFFKMSYHLGRNYFLSKILNITLIKIVL